MAPRLRVRRRQRQDRCTVTLEGAVDGSTACHVLDVLARTPSQARELVLDLSGLTVVEAFGLEVLSRGLRQLARERRVRILASPSLMPVLTSLADALVSSRAA